MSGLTSEMWNKWKHGNEIFQLISHAAVIEGGGNEQKWTDRSDFINPHCMKRAQFRIDLSHGHSEAGSCCLLMLNEGNSIIPSTRFRFNMAFPIKTLAVIVEIALGNWNSRKRLQFFRNECIFLETLVVFLILFTDNGLINYCCNKLWHTLA